MQLTEGPTADAEAVGWPSLSMAAKILCLFAGGTSKRQIVSKLGQSVLVS